MSTEIRVTKDTLTPALEDIVKNWEDKKTATLVKGGAKAITTAAQLATERLKNPGSYLQKFHVEVIRGKQMTLKNVHHAATIIELGTTKKGYRIPKTGKSAKLTRGTGEKKGKTIPAFIHPGLPARLIITDAIKKVFPEVLNELKNLLRSDKGE